MPHDFKVGDLVQCIDADGRKHTGLVSGSVYEVKEVDSEYIFLDTIPINKSEGRRLAHMYERFVRFGHAYSGGALTSVVSAPTSTTRDTRDHLEERLTALWLAVPANCCAKCAAPLPCKYHE